MRPFLYQRPPFAEVGRGVQNITCLLKVYTLQKQIFHFDEKNLSYTINRFNFFKLNDKIN